MDRISYKTLRNWLEGITSSKYVWRIWPSDDLRFEDLEGLTKLQSAPKRAPQTVMRKLQPVYSQPVSHYAEQIPFYKRPLAIAAVISLMMIALYQVIIPNDTSQTLQAFSGEQKEFQLPDGSIVSLNAGSQVVYDSKDFKLSRQLELSGEAWFSVEEGSRFVVNTEYGDVTVLGTEFNVYSRGNGFEVACASGSVSVRNGQGEKILKPGDQVSLNKGSNELVFASIETNKMGSWKQGAFYFEEEPVSNALAEISRQFGVKMQTSKVIDQSYTGLFKNGDLEVALDLVCLPLGLKYSISEQEGVQVVTIE